LVLELVVEAVVADVVAAVVAVLSLAATPPQAARASNAEAETAATSRWWWVRLILIFGSIAE